MAERGEEVKRPTKEKKTGVGEDSKVEDEWEDVDVEDDDEEFEEVDSNEEEDHEEGENKTPAKSDTNTFSVITDEQQSSSKYGFTDLGG
jgi:hypothetical protein